MDISSIHPEEQNTRYVVGRGFVPVERSPRDEVIVHSDGRVTFWSVSRQTWRHRFPAVALVGADLQALPAAERARLVRERHRLTSQK